MTTKATVNRAGTVSRAETVSRAGTVSHAGTAGYIAAAGHRKQQPDTECVQAGKNAFCVQKRRGFG